ncbi:MAG TPA: alanine racemase [Candidatus Acidoferrales bacterium]|nr:alanine racemase [Candidatus Acidoferrales bacterium]
MAPLKIMLNEFRWTDQYRISDMEDVLTPALVVYPEIVASNISCTLKLLEGSPDRWRAHIKTSKLLYTLRMLIDRGVTNFKCATTLELLIACQAGAKDVLLAFPVMGANARRVREIANQFPRVRISVLAENHFQVHQWRQSSIAIFLDLNPGMNRTGIELDRREMVLKLITQMQEEGIEFRGLHYYDGQFGGVEEHERMTAARAGYDRLLQLVAEIQRNSIAVPEVVTAGTPTFPCSLSHEGFRRTKFIHRVSPGTVVYNDATSLAQLSADYGYAPAVLVLARVVSAPHDGMITCDAGHKTVSADAGIPTCVVVGHPELTPASPSEEHLPMAVSADRCAPKVGDLLLLLPRHICPTVNNFDSAVFVRRGTIESIEKVTARGREEPLRPPVSVVR